MQSLLIVAHGSRREEANQEIRLLIRKLAARVGPRFGHVDCAFLEMAEPSIPQGIQQCAETGATDILVVPYFLSSGHHVVENIPAEVDKKRAEYSHINIRIADYLGSCKEGMVLALLSMVS